MPQRKKKRRERETRIPRIPSKFPRLSLALSESPEPRKGCGQKEEIVAGRWSEEKVRVLALVHLPSWVPCWSLGDSPTLPQFPYSTPAPTFHIKLIPEQRRGETSLTLPGVTFGYLFSLISSPPPSKVHPLSQLPSLIALPCGGMRQLTQDRS